MFLKTSAALLLIVSLLCAVRAQQATPALTEVQKLKVQVALQRIQIAEQQRELITAELEKARSDAQSLLSTLTVKDYQLNLDTLAYTPTTGEKQK